jgi:hypothetical protein
MGDGDYEHARFSCYERNRERKPFEVEIANTPAPCTRERREWPALRMLSDHGEGRRQLVEEFAAEAGLSFLVPDGMMVDFGECL